MTFHGFPRMAICPLENTALACAMLIPKPVQEEDA